MKKKLNVEIGRRHSSTSLFPLITTCTAATNSMAARFRRCIGRAPLALLALLALTLTLPVREAGAQGPPTPGPPTVTTLDATDVHANYAVLNGTVNPNGGSYVMVEFQWGTSINYDHVGYIAGPMGGYGYVPYSYKITTSDGFFSGATVHFRVMAYDSLGTAYGSDKSFSVPASPQPVTLPATAITTTSATLNGTANPDGWPTTAWFQWGATTSYGNLTSVTNLGSGTTVLPLSAPLAGLAPSVTYHFRVAATNQDGLLYGSDQSFTTLGLPQVSTLPATGVSTNSATLNGTVNPNGWPHHRLVPVGHHHQLRQSHLGDRPGQRDHRLASLRPTGRVNPECHLSLPRCGNERLRTGLRQRPELYRVGAAGSFDIARHRRLHQ